MGGQSVKQTSLQDIIDYLNDLQAYALSIGMSLKEYWEDEPELINVYLKAEEIRSRKKNNELWIQGAYFYYALCSVSPMFNSLAKDHKPKPYLKEPFALNEEEEEERKYQKFKQRMFDLTNRSKGGQ